SPAEDAPLWMTRSAFYGYRRSIPLMVRYATLLRMTRPENRLDARAALGQRPGSYDDGQHTRREHGAALAARADTPMDHCCGHGACCAGDGVRLSIRYTGALGTGAAYPRRRYAHSGPCGGAADRYHPEPRYCAG